MNASNPQAPAQPATFKIRGPATGSAAVISSSEIRGQLRHLRELRLQVSPAPTPVSIEMGAADTAAAPNRANKPRSRVLAALCPVPAAELHVPSRFRPAT